MFHIHTGIISYQREGYREEGILEKPKNHKLRADSLTTRVSAPAEESNIINEVNMLLNTQPILTVFLTISTRTFGRVSLILDSGENR